MVIKEIIEFMGRKDGVQVDGKVLCEHMGVRKNINLENGRCYTQFVVDRKIDKVILDIPVYYLIRGEESYWYSVDLFIQAVLNCVNKSYNFRNKYVRARARKILCNTRKRNLKVPFIMIYDNHILI